MAPDIATSDTAPPGPPRRWPVILGGALLLATAAFWAGRVTLTPPPGLLETADEDLVVTVTERTIGQTLDYGARTSRASRTIATNALAGVVTAAPDQPVAVRAVGDVLYEVGGIPVRIVEGEVPFHRDLSLGMAGRDVEQLEGALVALKYLDVADSTFDEATGRGVSEWQRNLGVAPTGMVGLGELVAADSLPAGVVVDAQQVWAGAVLGGGEVVVSMTTGDPQFILPLSPGQMGLVPADAPMTVEGLGHSWPAVWGSSRPNDELGAGELVTLTSPDGGPVCGDDCDAVPAEQTWVTVHIEVIPRTTGPTVPVAAVSTDATGQAWVTVVDGNARERRPVTVSRSHAGLAVVEGVEVGESVQALASADVTPEASATATSSPRPSPSETP